MGLEGGGVFVSPGWVPPSGVEFDPVGGVGVPGGLFGEGLGAEEAIGVGVPRDGFSAGLVVGDFFSVGDCCAEGDRFPVPCCVLVGWEATRVEVEEIWRLEDWFAVLLGVFTDDGFGVATEAIVGVGWRGDGA